MVQCQVCDIHVITVARWEPELGEICELCAQPPSLFSAKVLARLAHCYECSKASQLIVNREALGLERDGFSEDDACIHCDEETALKQMRAIHDKYRTR